MKAGFQITALAIAGLLIGFVVGDRLGRDDPANFSEAAAPYGPKQQGVPGYPADYPTALAKSEPVAGDEFCERRAAALARDVKRLKEQVALQQRWADELALEAFGVPFQWTDRIPEKYTPKFFESVLEEAIKTCAQDIVVMNLDCSEPPCIAQLSKLKSMSDHYIPNCESWAKHYGAASSMSSSKVECGDGRSESVVQISPPMTELLEILGPKANDNWQKRFKARHNALRDQWICRDGGPPVTEP